MYQNKMLSFQVFAGNCKTHKLKKGLVFHFNNCNQSTLSLPTVDSGT